MNLFKKTARQFDWKYSLREICLIVIGILIALGINNWNEQRKLYHKETNMLRELQSALENDMIDIKINQRIHNSSLKSTTLLIDHLKAKKPYSDTLDKHFGEALGSTMFLSDHAVYTSLQNYGRELISNNSIRNRLSVLYAHDYAYIKKLEELDAQTLIHIFQPFYSAHFKEFRLFETATPINYALLLNNPEYVSNLEWWRSNRLYTTSRYDTISEKVTDLLNLINLELQARE